MPPPRCLPVTYSGKSWATRMSSELSGYPKDHERFLENVCRTIRSSPSNNNTKQSFNLVGMCIAPLIPCSHKHGCTVTRKNMLFHPLADWRRLLRVKGS